MNEDHPDHPLMRATAPWHSCTGEEARRYHATGSYAVQHETWAGEYLYRGDHFGGGVLQNALKTLAMTPDENGDWAMVKIPELPPGLTEYEAKALLAVDQAREAYVTCNREAQSKTRHDELLTVFECALRTQWLTLRGALARLAKL